MSQIIRKSQMKKKAKKKNHNFTSGVRSLERSHFSIHSMALKFTMQNITPREAGRRGQAMLKKCAVGRAECWREK
jgi:hypothetical protein